eukprot:1546776-Karenia_brevis.AAC.1
MRCACSLSLFRFACHVDAAPGCISSRGLKSRTNKCLQPCRNVSHNKGDSWQLSSGEYVRGGIWCLSDNGQDEFTLQGDVVGPRGNVMYEAGKTYHGCVLDTHRQLQRFNGNSPHFTMPVESGI